MPSFRPIIRDTYLEILERNADSSGLENYNRLMNQGMSEAQLRESFLRSAEFAQKNPLNLFAQRVGMNVHIPSNEILDDVGRNLGVPWIRVDFDWFRIEPQQGAFRWEPWDRLVDRAINLDLSVFATLSYTPSWASSNPGNPRISDPPASVRFWTDFVRNAVLRFGSRIRHWQLWNEPNLDQFWSGSMSQYRTSILEQGARTVKQTRPNSTIVGPGLANLGGWRDWFNEIMRSKSALDVISHHNYASNGRDAIVNLREDGFFSSSLRTLMRQNGVDDRPFWLTETGRKSSDGNQRQYVNDVLLTLRQELWVNRLFFFHYWDGPGQGNGGFGIVQEDRSPKPAYDVLRNALRPSAPAASFISA